jgi:hypothetical protein
VFDKALAKVILILVFVMLLLLNLFGAEPPRPAAASTAPSIDGRLDDPVWRSALVFADFKTGKPDFGKTPTEMTEVLFAYDSKNLYFGFRCFDGEPGRIKATLSKRDEAESDDRVCIILDMFNDQQNGYALFVNPRGVQMDGILSAEGQCDSSFDMVWTSQGTLTGSGYEVELAVPLKSLRHPARRTLTFGVMAVRMISRKSEEDYCPEFSMSRDRCSPSCERSRSPGSKGPTIELIPALTFSRGNVRQGASGRPARARPTSASRAKVGLTSDLTVDACYNPDFSQVESDAGRVDINLRNPLYYPEKRPFFLEGLEDFSFAGSLEQNPLIAVVHTRTIVDPKVGFKLTGKAGSRNQVSSIFALDQYPGTVAAEGGSPAAAGMDAPFSIVRYKRLLSKDAYLGGFFTSRSFDGASNVLGGLDGRFRLTNTMTMEGFAFNSWSRPQRGGQAVKGEALGVKFNLQSRKSTVHLGAYDIDPNFRTDTGFVTRTGVRMLCGFANYKFYPKSKLFQRIDPYYYFSQIYDIPSGLFESRNYFALRILMPRQTMVRFMGIVASEVFAGRRFRADGYWITLSSQVTTEASLQFNLVDSKSILYDPAAPAQGDGLSLTAGLRYEPTQQLSTEMDLAYDNFYRAADGSKVYGYTILRNKTTFQVNKSLFFRGIVEYNAFRRRLTADVLACFTSIPGTVLFAGYGSAFERVNWDPEVGTYLPAQRFWPTQRAFFFKASYLWRF